MSRPVHVALSTAELELLCDVVGVAPPDALDVSPRDGRAGPDVRDAVAGRGLLHGRSAAPALASALRRLDGAPLVLELHRAHPSPLAVVVAVDAGHAVVAVREGDRVSLRRVAPERAVDVLTAPIGPLRPAPGRPVHVPSRVLADAVAAAGDDAHRLVVELMRRGTSGSGARLTVGANQDVDALFRIGVALRGTGDTRAGPYQIMLSHNASGHHCQRPSAGPPESLMTVPATGERLAREIDELVRAAADLPDQRRGAGRGSTRPADAGGIGSATGAVTTCRSGSSTG